MSTGLRAEEKQGSGSHSSERGLWHNTSRAANMFASLHNSVQSLELSGMPPSLTYLAELHPEAEARR